jgi:hypothetical protein
MNSLRDGTGKQFAPSGNLIGVNSELIRDNRESIPPRGSERKNGSTAIRSPRGSPLFHAVAQDYPFAVIASSRRPLADPEG